jgi:hypothetical protein
MSKGHGTKSGDNEEMANFWCRKMFYHVPSCQRTASSLLNSTRFELFCFVSSLGLVLRRTWTICVQLVDPSIQAFASLCWCTCAVGPLITLQTSIALVCCHPAARPGLVIRLDFEIEDVRLCSPNTWSTCAQSSGS